jgi:hypothetical protein
MSEKEDSPRLSAPAPAAEGSRDEQPKKPQQPMSESKPHVIHNKNDSKREAIMEPQRPSDLYNVPRGMLDRSLQAQLGRQLRAIFSDVAQEPVPDRFIKLLEALEAREKRR